MGGPQGPPVSRSPGVSPQKKAGRPIGPSTPRCSPQSFLLFVLSRMSRNKFSDWFLVQASGLFSLLCLGSPLDLAVLGTQRFLSSRSGTLSSLLFSLSERYRSGLAGTHAHTGGAPSPSCLASPVLLFFSLLCSLASFCCHLVLVSDSRGSVKYPQILVFSGLLASSEAFSDFTEVVLQLRFSSFLFLTSSFLPFAFVWRLHNTARKGWTRFRTWHTARSSYLPSARLRAEGRRRARPVGPGLNLKEAHFCFIWLGMPEGHRNRALARRRRALMSHGRSVFPRHLGQGLSPVFRKFRCFVAL